MLTIHTTTGILRHSRLSLAVYAVFAILLAGTAGAAALHAQDTTGRAVLPHDQEMIVTSTWQAIGRDSTLVDEYQKIAAIYKSRKMYAEELEAAEKMAAANPNSPIAHFTLGDAHLDNSSPELAVVSLTQALRLEPSFVRVRVTIAEAYAMMHSYDTAIAHLDTALILNPRYAQAHVQRASLLIQLGRDSAAIENLRTAAELLPDTYGPWMKLARTLYKIENYPDAIEAAQYAMSLNPQSPDPLYLYGELLMKLERKNEAVQVFERFMLRFPTERRALEAERIARNLQGK